MHAPTRTLLFAGLVAMVATCAAGCATVQPWQRGRLANARMVFDYNGGLASFDNHWQSSREGAAGGFGFQGGGCGCK